MAFLASSTALFLPDSSDTQSHNFLPPLLCPHTCEALGQAQASTQLSRLPTARVPVLRSPLGELQRSLSHAVPLAPGSNASTSFPNTIFPSNYLCLENACWLLPNPAQGL